MEKEEVIAAINTLPEEKIVELLNWLCDDTVFSENTEKNINREFADDNPYEIVCAVEKAGGKYSSLDKWFSYNFDVLLSGNTLRELIPFYDSVVEQIAELYLDNSLDEYESQIIDTALGKETEDTELQDELEWKKIEEDGERKLITLIRELQSHGEQGLIERCLADDDFRLSCYRRYKIK